MLGALYMLVFAQRFLFGAVKAPHQPFTDLSAREKTILVAIVAAVFALGLYPDEPMRKTELAAKQFRAVGQRAAHRRADWRYQGRAMNPVVAVVIGMLPEHILLGAIVLLIAVEIVASRRWNALPISLLAVVLAALASLALHSGGFGTAPFPGQLMVDPTATLSKALILALAIPVLLLARDDFAEPQFHILLLSSLYGACVLVSSESFLTLFLGLELMSLPVYALVLLAYRRPESAEAALKYLVLGGTASATLLMGASLLYGGTGSLELATFREALGSADAMAQMAVALVIAAFFLKAAVVPFHAWAPDAYEAAAVPVTAYMAAIIKAGVLARRRAAIWHSDAYLPFRLSCSPGFRSHRSSGAISQRCASRACAA